jgi:hypothetical protein
MSFDISANRVSYSCSSFVLSFVDEAELTQNSSRNLVQKVSSNWNLKIRSSNWNLMTSGFVDSVNYSCFDSRELCQLKHEAWAAAYNFTLVLATFLKHAPFHFRRWLSLPPASYPILSVIVTTRTLSKYGKLSTRRLTSENAASRTQRERAFIRRAQFSTTFEQHAGNYLRYKVKNSWILI